MKTRAKLSTKHLTNLLDLLRNRYTQWHTNLERAE